MLLLADQKTVLLNETLILSLSLSPAPLALFLHCSRTLLLLFISLFIYLFPSPVLIWRQRTIRSILGIIPLSSLIFISKWEICHALCSLSFDGRYQFGVAFAIDLIKGITHCLMSFTHDWMVNNHPVISDPELFFTHPPHFSHFPPFSLSWRARHSVAQRRGNGNQLRPWFEEFFAAFFPPHSQVKLIPLLVLL